MNSAHDAPLLRAALYAAVRRVCSDFDIVASPTGYRGINLRSDTEIRSAADNGLFDDEPDSETKPTTRRRKPYNTSSTLATPFLSEPDIPPAYFSSCLGTSLRKRPAISELEESWTSGAPPMLAHDVDSLLPSLVLNAAPLADELRDVRLVCPDREGYPKQPYYTYLADAIFLWSQTGTCPRLPTVKMEQIEETEVYRRLDDSAWTTRVTSIMDELSESMVLHQVPTACNHGVLAGVMQLLQIFMFEQPFPRAKKQPMVSLQCVIPSAHMQIRQINIPLHFLRSLKGFIHALGPEGILYFIGLRSTTGSLRVAPPPIDVLLRSANELHKPTSQLTVAARALSKHAHRDSSKWWGECKGSETKKSEDALNVVKRILHGAVWINIHTMVDGSLLEVRCKEGYGARWSYDGATFRGFLEPHDPAGHESKWRH